MLFTSFHFFVLLIITWILYYATQRKAVQRTVATLASFVFYAWHFPLLLLLLLSSVIVNILASYLVNTTAQRNFRRLYAIGGVATNLAILCFFKYSPLIGETFFLDRWTSVGEFLIGIPLPIGVSFFTFQGISLVVDTFKEKKPATVTGDPSYSFGNYAANISLFIAFFPQLIAGPIVKAHEFLPQIKPKRIRDIDFERCFKNLVTGYFLKMVVADNLKDQTYWIAYPYFESYSVTELVVLLVGYAMQIFADFAGYSLIAIGVAGLFGYQLKDNFNFPYVSTSFSELWRRWHISLSSFLLEYLYIPLGGNRKGAIRTYLNLLITMTLGGLWHGAVWGYAFWGFYHGVALSLERFAYQSLPASIRVPQFLKGTLVFIVFALGLLVIKFPNLLYAIGYLECLFTNRWLPKYPANLLRVFFVLIYSLPVVAYHALYLLKESHKFAFLRMHRWEPLLYGTLLFLVLSNSGSSADFFYFQF